MFCYAPEIERNRLLTEIGVDISITFERSRIQLAKVENQLDGRLLAVLHFLAVELRPRTLAAGDDINNPEIFLAVVMDGVLYDFLTIFYINRAKVNVGRLEHGFGRCQRPCFFLVSEQPASAISTSRKRGSMRQLNFAIIVLLFIDILNTLGF